MHARRPRLVALALASQVTLAAAAPFVREERTFAFADLQLELTLPALEGIVHYGASGEQLKGRWTGKLGASDVDVSLVLLPWSFTEPGDVTELVVDHMRDNGKDLDVREAFFPQGSFGHASFASVVEAAILHRSSGDVVGTQYVLGATLPGQGYAVEVQCTPALDDEGRAALRGFLEKGIVYAGEPRDPEWTDEEVLERWLRDAPDDLHEDFRQALERKKTAEKAIVRSKHYLIMTNSSSGKKFAKQMDENYEEIREIFPFEDVPGRRLMPVFLFRTNDQYYDYYVKVANTTKEAAARSKGHAWRDYYATWYEAPGDSVHIHEQTHQIFANRLRLGGGGSWFQEGVAEYVETSENDRNEIASLVEKGRHTPLVDFVRLKSLLYSSEKDRKSGGSEAGDHYKQAALLIEFLRESDFGEERFERGRESEEEERETPFEAFLWRMGKVPRGNLAAIEAVFQEVYGVGVAGVDEAFQEYCKGR